MTAIVTHRAGAPLHGLPLFARALVQLARWCRAHPDGIVHVHSAVRGSLFRKAIVVELACLMRRPVILHVHAGVGDIEAFVARRSELQMRAFRRAFRRATRVVTVSEAGAVTLRRTFERRDVAVVPNAAPVIAASGSCEQADVTVLYLGGFEDPAKGGTVLLRALPRLMALDDTARVTLAGPGAPPPLRDGVAAGRVAWAGWLDAGAKARAFASAQIVIVPSISEGLPIALLEAMGHGRAIVASRVGGIPDVVEHGREGLLVAPGDEEELARAIAALTSDEPLRRRLGRAARARAAEFSESIVVDRLAGLYAEVVA